jgi:Phage integrase family
LIDRNPLEDVEGVGRRKHGKEQLRIDEARKWLAKARELADQEFDGAIAAMMTLLMGMRCSEVISRVVRDIDDNGTLLWIPDSKTEKGKRTLRVPEMLRPYLRVLAEGKRSGDLLFGHRDRGWPRHWVQRICGEAAVPQVTAHGQRGLHSTLAVEAGETSRAVADALGHESFTTTARSYAQPEAVGNARQARARCACWMGASRMRHKALFSEVILALSQSFRESFRGPIWHLGAAREGLNGCSAGTSISSWTPDWRRGQGSIPRAEELRFGSRGKYSSTGNAEKWERLARLGTNHSEFRSEVAFWRTPENSKGLASLRDL